MTLCKKIVNNAVQLVVIVITVEELSCIDIHKHFHKQLAVRNVSDEPFGPRVESLWYISGGDQDDNNQRSVLIPCNKKCHFFNFFK